MLIRIVTLLQECLLTRIWYNSLRPISNIQDLNRFLIDVQEELMDALLYIEAAKRCLTDEIEEAMLNRINIIGQNGNDGLHYHDIEINEEETL